MEQRRLPQIARLSVARLLTMGARANRAVGLRTGLSLTRVPRANSLQRELANLIDRFEIMTVLDVGAHRGGFGERLRAESGFAGRIVSFEPARDAFVQLESLARADNRWEVHNAALGSVEGELELHEYEGDGQLNSLRQLGEYAEKYQPGIGRIGGYSVPVRRLDALWPSLGLAGERVLLKTDTQGFDVEVMRGAGRCLDEIPAVLMEVAVQPLYVGSPVMHEVLAEMWKAGFELTGAFPIHRYADGARVIEFDCTFVNQREFA